LLTYLANNSGWLLLAATLAALGLRVFQQRMPKPMRIRIRR